MAQILVVDDDADTRDALGLLLEEEGHQVVEAQDGLRALNLLRRTSFRWVVLFDYRMPTMDGQAFLHAVAADPDLARRHAYIAMTASPHALDLALAEMRSALGVPLLHKPFGLDELVNAVAQAAARLTNL